MRTTYVIRNGKMVNKRTGEISGDADHIATPMVMRDIPSYPSPIDGRMITSRSERREDFKRNGCVEAGDIVKRDFRNEKCARLAHARGLI